MAIPHSPLIRACDVGLAVALLIVLSPLLGIIGILIKLDSPGQILFTQWRPGKEGNLFRILKFRTMHRNAPLAPPPYRMNAQGRIEPVMKVKNDSRVTPLGKWLRRYSLDELPQLWNIIKGEMSFVGTRPPTAEEITAYSESQKARLRGVPGLTGIAQIMGRTDLDFASIVAADVYYIQHRSLGLYLKILLQTIPCLLSGKSAY